MDPYVQRDSACAASAGSASVSMVDSEADTPETSVDSLGSVTPGPMNTEPLPGKHFADVLSRIKTLPYASFQLVWNLAPREQELQIF